MAEYINWSSLPGVPWITGKFIDGDRKLSELCGGDWRNPDDLKIGKDRRLKLIRPNGLGDAIRAGYGALPVSETAEKNISALNRADTLAVVTGQQVGIFGGPLYTYYKALTTILMARELEDTYNVRVVPVFWMETSDADFTEVNHVAFPSNDHDYRAVYSPSDFITGKSISYHKLSEDIVQVKKLVCEWLEPLQYGKNYIDAIDNAYVQGRTFGDAFRELMNFLLGDSGLVFIDPSHPEIIERSRDFWKYTIQTPEAINEPFARTAQNLLDNNFSLQVAHRDDAFPMFYTDDEGFRRRIYNRDGRWSIGRNGHTISSEELVELANAEPHRLSPSVLLRPLLQDWLLPTWIYIGGPSEIAYHAQLSDAYEFFSIPRPLIAPRLGMTLVDKTSRRYLNRHGWKVSEVIAGREMMLRSGGKSTKLAELFDSGDAQLSAWFTRLQQSAEEASVGIALDLDKAGRKIRYQWDKLRRITLTKITERDKARMSHVEILLARLLPDGLLQERHDSILYYLAAYGAQMMPRITKEFDLSKPQHLVFDLEEL